VSAAAPRRRSLLDRLGTVLRSRVTRVVFIAVTVGLALWAVAARWSEVVDAFGRLDPFWVVVAFAATAVNLVFVGFMWRTALHDLGAGSATPRLGLLAAFRVFFVGQLGKYLPGSVWPIVVQAELASEHGVPRRRTATATVVSILVAVTAAIIVVLATLPFVHGVLPPGFGWAVLLIIPLALVLSPPVFGTLADRALKLAGREPLERRTSVRGTIRSVGWAMLSWTACGLQIWALCVPLGAPRDLETLVLVTGGYALAWTVGFVVVIAPAGAGAREVALAAVLAPVLQSGEVVVVVLLSRVLFTVCDLGFAGIAAATAVRHTRRRRAQGSGSGPEPDPQRQPAARD
jgi:uncharacterized membrane protein YbhN (UPF0104 family)